jgi:hypothetical protein
MPPNKTASRLAGIDQASRSLRQALQKIAFFHSSARAYSARSEAEIGGLHGGSIGCCRSANSIGTSSGLTVSRCVTPDEADYAENHPHEPHEERCLANVRHAPRLRPRPFPDEAASLLPGHLTATRTGLTRQATKRATTKDQTTC